MTRLDAKLMELLPFGLVPELLDSIPYATFVVERDLKIRCANAAARARFELTDDAIERINREREVTSPMREFRDRYFNPWLAGESPRPIPYRWDSGAGAGDFLLVPFPMPGQAGVFALVLIPAAMLAEVQAERVLAGGGRAQKWYVPGAAQAEAESDANEIRALDASHIEGGKLSALTTREWEIARRIASGDRVSLLAEDLRISPNTVRNHLKAIFRKLGVNSQPQLVRTVRALAQQRAANGE